MSFFFLCFNIMVQHCIHFNLSCLLNPCLIFHFKAKAMHDLTLLYLFLCQDAMWSALYWRDTDYPHVPHDNYVSLWSPQNTTSLLYTSDPANITPSDIMISFSCCVVSEWDSVIAIYCNFIFCANMNVGTMVAVMFYVYNLANL